LLEWTVRRPGRAVDIAETGIILADDNFEAGGRFFGRTGKHVTNLPIEGYTIYSAPAQKLRPVINAQMV
jgi:hypothetical protein